MARLLEAVREAAEATGGLVDGTLLGEIEAAGYAATSPRRCRSTSRCALAPRAPPGRAEPAFALARRRRSTAGRSRRPPGVGFDSGGLAKGLFADLIAERLRAAQLRRRLRRRPALRRPRRGGSRSPTRSAAPALHVFELRDGAVATSGIGRRSWLDADGRPAHHLLDPATGRPAFTGVVQATALAPTAVEAEWRAKAAVLAGPDAPRLARPTAAWSCSTTAPTSSPNPRPRISEEEQHMNKRGFRRVAVFASAAALAGGAVAGCGSDAATTNGAAAPRSSRTASRPGRRDGLHRARQGARRHRPPSCRPRCRRTGRSPASSASRWCAN